MNKFLKILLPVTVITFSTMLLIKENLPLRTFSPIIKDDKVFKPNFIIMFVDDWGWGDAAINWESSKHVTPNIDQLATSGIRFTDLHVGASVCTPSRAALLTGRLGLRTGTTGLFGPSSVGGLPVNETTIAEVLKDVGYNTFILGKWHLGHHGPFHPIKRGFDYYYGVPYSVDQGCLDYPGYNWPMCLPCDPKAQAKWKNLTGNKTVDDEDLSSKAVFCNYNYNALPLYENETIIEQPLDLRKLTNGYIAKFKQQIRLLKEKEKPFFGYVPFSHVHVPLGYDPKFTNKTGMGPFEDTLAELDASVGAIINILKEEELIDNTLIWLLGDNGPWEEKCQFAGTPGPFLGLWQKRKGGGGGSWKGTIWEGGHRVPGIVSLPGKIKPAISDALVSSMDIFPTVVKLADAKMPSDRHFDGMDISDVLFEGQNEAHEALFHPEDFNKGHISAVRYREYKAIYRTGGTLRDCGNHQGPQMTHDPPLLFNLKEDRSELFPLDTTKPKYKSIISVMNKLLKEKYADIEHDRRSKTDYRTDSSVQPCCNPKNEFCRCFPEYHF